MNRSTFVRAIALALAVPALALGAPALAQSSPIKVGVIGPFKLTPGRDIQEASNLAVEEINAAGGVLGRKLQLVFAETEQSPEKGKTAVERLLFVDKVDVIIGEHRSEVALAVQPIIAENKKIFLSTGTAQSGTFCAIFISSTLNCRRSGSERACSMRRSRSASSGTILRKTSLPAAVTRSSMRRESDALGRLASRRLRSSFETAALMLFFGRPVAATISRAVTPGCCAAQNRITYSGRDTPTRCSSAR